MSSQSSAGRRRSNISSRQYSAEDQALNMISKEAEARLAAKRAARAEAREIRMKEIEKQQKQSEEKQDRVYELTNEHAAAKVRQQLSCSRRGSTESNDSTSDSKDVDFKAEVRDLEEKYKAAMMSSAQLDNEKQSLVYQVELLKDQLEEHDEGYTEVQREYKDKCRECDFQKRDLKSVEHELSILKQQLEIKDRLIEESGFVIVSNDKGEPVLERQSSESTASRPSSSGSLPTGAFLVSQETKAFLEKAGDGTLGTDTTSPVVDVEYSTSKTLSVDSRQTLANGSDLQATNTLQISEKKDEVDSKVEEVNRDEDSSAESRASGRVVHESNPVITPTDVVCEHEVVTHEVRGNGDKKAQPNDTKEEIDNRSDRIHSCPMSGEGDGKIERENSDVPSVSISSCMRTGHLNEDSDEGDEFYDAVSATPSPFEKQVSEFDIPPNLDEQNTVQRNDEGTSIEIVVPEGRTHLSTSDANVRSSVELKNVTVTESYTEEQENTLTIECLDVKEENAQNIKEDIQNQSSVDAVFVENTKESNGNVSNQDETVESLVGKAVNLDNNEKINEYITNKGSQISVLSESSTDGVMLVDNTQEENGNVTNENDQGDICADENVTDKSSQLRMLTESSIDLEMLVNTHEASEDEINKGNQENICNAGPVDQVKFTESSTLKDELQNTIVEATKSDETGNSGVVEEDMPADETDAIKQKSGDKKISVDDGSTDSTTEELADLKIVEEREISVNEENGQIEKTAEVQEVELTHGSEGGDDLIIVTEEGGQRDNVTDLQTNAVSKTEEVQIMTETNNNSEQQSHVMMKEDITKVSVGEDGDNQKESESISGQTEEKTSESVNQEEVLPASEKTRSDKSKTLHRVFSIETESDVCESYDFDDIDDVLYAAEGDQAQISDVTGSKGDETQNSPAKDPPDTGSCAKSPSPVKESPKSSEETKGAKGGGGGDLAMTPMSNSEDSLETEDLEGALDKSMKDKERSKTHKKSKKFKLFKNVFK